MSSRIVQNSLLSAISGGSTLIAGFASTVLVARLLGTTATGSVAYALWFATMAVTLLDFGVCSTLARYIPEVKRGGGKSQMDTFAGALFRPYALTFIVVILAVALFQALSGARLLTSGDRLVGVGAVAALCALQLLANFALGELRGTQNFAAAAMTTFVSMVVQISCVTVGALSMGELGVILGYCVGSAPLALRALRQLRKQPTQGARIERRILRFAAYSWAGGLASALVWSRSEVFFLERSWGPEAVALLTVGFTFSNLAAQGPMLLTGALLPFFSERVATDRDAVNRAFATSTRILAFLALPLCFGAAAVMPGLIALSFGPHFAAASTPGSIIVLATALAAPGAVGTHVMYARDRSDFLFYSNSVGALLSILSGLLIIPRYGLLGAATCRAAIQVLLVASGFWFLGARLKCPVPLAHLARLLAAASLCAVAARLTLDALPHSISLITAIAVGAVVYLIAVRWLSALPAGDILRFSELQARLPRPLRWAPTTLARLLSRDPILLAGAE